MNVNTKNNKLHIVLFIGILLLDILLRFTLLFRLPEDALTPSFSLAIQILFSIAAPVISILLMKQISDFPTALWSGLLLSVCPFCLNTLTNNSCFFMMSGLSLLGLSLLLLEKKNKYFLPLSFLIYGLCFFCSPLALLLVPLLLVGELAFFKWAKQKSENNLRIISLLILLLCFVLAFIYHLMQNHFTLPDFNRIGNNLSDLFSFLFTPEKLPEGTVLMPYGFFGIAAGYMVFLGFVLLVLALLHSLRIKKKPLTILIIIQVMVPFLIMIFTGISVDNLSLLFIPLALCGAMGFQTVSHMFTAFYWKKISTVAFIFFLLLETYKYLGF